MNSLIRKVDFLSQLEFELILKVMNVRLKTSLWILEVFLTKSSILFRRLIFSSKDKMSLHLPIIEHRQVLRQISLLLLKRLVSHNFEQFLIKITQDTFDSFYR